VFNWLPGLNFSGAEGQMAKAALLQLDISIASSTIARNRSAHPFAVQEQPIDLIDRSF
jgi:hypothetical protein